MPSIEKGVLDFSGKNITNLEGLESIHNSDSVRVLDLSNNKIRVVPTEAFIYFSQLQELNLSLNKIQTLPANVFRYLSQLNCLSLGFNQITVLPEDIFLYLSQLEILNLSCNNITIVPENIFAQLSNLKRLNLGDNELQVLPENIFKNLTQLKILELQGNQLRVFPKALCADLNILLLDIARNWFKETACEFRQKYLTALYTVDLTYKDNGQELKEWVQQDLFNNISLLTAQQKQEQKALVQDNMHWLEERVFWYDYDCDYEVPTQDDQGNTALHKAIKLCNPLLVKIIAKMFSRLLRVHNNWGQIPLHVVMTVQDKAVSLAMTKVLLAERRHPELLLQMKDGEGNTPVQVALNCNNYKVLQFLMAFGQGYKSDKLDYILQQSDIAQSFEKLRIAEKR